MKSFIIKKFLYIINEFISFNWIANINSNGFYIWIM